jgi:Holliday junction DNA helicase RuvB
VGATTRSGLLAAPLRNRFGIFHHLDFYSPEELSKIVKNSAKILNLGIDESAADEISRRARGTPRIVNRLLRRVRDYAQVKEPNKKITLEIVDNALNSLRIDKAGLDEADRKVLKTIIEVYEGGPVGIDSLAATLNEEIDTIEDTIEPFLLKTGYLKRTSRGREVTALAYEHFNKTPKKQNQKELF